MFAGEYQLPTSLLTLAKAHQDSLMGLFVAKQQELMGGVEGLCNSGGNIELTEPTTQHGNLTYKVGFVNCGGPGEIGLQIDCSTDNSDPMSVCYANLIGRLLGEDLKAALISAGKNVVSVGYTDYALSAEAAYTSEEFKHLISALEVLAANKQIAHLIEKKPVAAVEGVGTKAETVKEEVFRVSYEDLLPHITNNNLRAVFLLMRERGVKTFELRNSYGLWKFDLVGEPGGCYLDMFDVLGFEPKRLVELLDAPEVQNFNIGNENNQNGDVEVYHQLMAVPPPQAQFMVPVAQAPTTNNITENIVLESPKERSMLIRPQLNTQKPKALKTRVLEHTYTAPQRPNNLNQMKGAFDVETVPAEEIDVTVGTPAKRVKKGTSNKQKRVRRSVGGNNIRDVYNLKAITEASHGNTPVEQTNDVLPHKLVINDNGKGAATDQREGGVEQRPINVYMGNEKEANPMSSVQEASKVGMQPQNLSDKITVNFNHEKLLEDLKAILAAQEKNDTKRAIDVVDHIKLNQTVPQEYVQLIDNLQVKLHELSEKAPGNIVMDNDVVLSEIGTLRKQIEDLKIPENGGDNLSIDMDEVIEKLRLIEEKLESPRNPTEYNISDHIGVTSKGNDDFVKLVDELRVDIQNLKEKNANIIVDSPDVQEVTDKLTILLEDKLKNIRLDDHINIEHPNIVIDQPDVTGVLDEVKKMIVNVENNIKVQIDEKLKEHTKEPNFIIDLPEKQKINISDTIEIDQEAQKKGQKEEIIENIYAEVDKPVKKEENETVITNEYLEKSGQKEEENTIINEYQEKGEPVVQTPKQAYGFMPSPMMMPPAFMPPPMPMPAPLPQQPIVITQNQSDEEEGTSFWSNFLKVLLILLLLASIIGLGFLLWKNAQKTNEHKPEQKPSNDKPEQPTKEEINTRTDNPTTPSKTQTSEGDKIQPLCKDGSQVQLNVDSDKVTLGTDVGSLTKDAKAGIDLEQVGTHNKLIASDGTTIDTRRIEINGDRIYARDWNGSLTNAKVYSGTIENGHAVIDGKTYTIADSNGKAYSSGAIDVASQTSYSRNGDQTLSTDFGTLKQDLQTSNNSFTLNTTTENGTVISSLTTDDISNNSTIQNMLKDRLNDSSISKGEYNRIMDALDDGKLNDSYLQKVNNSTTGYSLNNSNNLGNSASV